MNAGHDHLGFDVANVRDAALRVLPGILALYVFGSHAKGQARIDSDLDLAVLPDKSPTALCLFEARQALEAVLGRDVDLVDLRAASSVLRSEVVNGGLLIYRRDPLQTLDFEARVLGEYAELQEATHALRQDIHRRGSVYAK